MESNVQQNQSKNTEKFIDNIQNILIFEKSKVNDEPISENKLDRFISDSKEDLTSDDDQEEIDSGKDENENKLNLKRAETFYKDAQKYWKSISPTVDGMLGGFSNINFTDIRGSQDFIKEIFKMKPSPNKNVALDCGAGIGRVSKHLLMPIFNTVDVVEQDEHFANSIKEYVGNSSKLGTIYNQGLQELQPKLKYYDVIWSQWVLGHLTNDDFVKFFQRCTQGLSKNGVVIIKENITSTESVDYDEVDSSVTRPLQMFKALLAESGLRIIKMVRQNNFPSGIFPVYMFALKPVKKSI